VQHPKSDSALALTSRVSVAGVGNVGRSRAESSIVQWWGRLGVPIVIRSGWWGPWSRVLGRTTVSNAAHHRVPSYRAGGLCMKSRPSHHPLLSLLYSPPCLTWRPESASKASARVSLFKIRSWVLTSRQRYLAWNGYPPQLRSLPERPARQVARELPRQALSETPRKQGADEGSLPSNVHPRHACGAGSRSCGV
jgi:hypothetical protein